MCLSRLFFLFFPSKSFSCTLKNAQMSAHTTKKIVFSLKYTLAINEQMQKNKWSKLSTKNTKKKKTFKINRIKGIQFCLFCCNLHSSGEIENSLNGALAHSHHISLFISSKKCLITATLRLFRFCYEELCQKY